MNIYSSKARGSKISCPKSTFEKMKSANAPFSDLLVKGSNKFPKAELAIWNFGEPNLIVEEFGCYKLQILPESNEKKVPSFSLPAEPKEIKQTKINSFNSENLESKKNKTDKSLRKKAPIKANFENDLSKNSISLSIPENSSQSDVINSNETFYKTDSSISSEGDRSNLIYKGKFIDNENTKQEKFLFCKSSLIEKTFQQLLMQNSEIKKKIEKYRLNSLGSKSLKEIENKNENGGFNLPETLCKEGKLESFQEDFQKFSIPEISEVLDNEITFDGRNKSNNINKTKKYIPGNKSNTKNLLKREKELVYHTFDPKAPKNNSLSEKRVQNFVALPKINLNEKILLKQNDQETINVHSEPVFGRKLKCQRKQKSQEQIPNNNSSNETNCFKIEINEKKLPVLPTYDEAYLPKIIITTPTKNNKLHPTIENSIQSVGQTYDNQEDQSSISRTTVEKFADLHYRDKQINFSPKSKNFPLNMKRFFTPIIVKVEEQFIGDK